LLDLHGRWPTLMPDGLNLLREWCRAAGTKVALFLVLAARKLV